MEQILTSEQMRHFETKTISEIGIPDLVLMERAALAVVQRMIMATVVKMVQTKTAAGWEFWELTLDRDGDPHRDIFQQTRLILTAAPTKP